MTQQPRATAFSNFFSAVYRLKEADYLRDRSARVQLRDTTFQTGKCKTLPNNSCRLLPLSQSAFLFRVFFTNVFFAFLAVSSTTIVLKCLL